MRIKEEAFALLWAEQQAVTDSLKADVDLSAKSDAELAADAGIRLGEWEALMDKKRWTFEECAVVAIGLGEASFSGEE